jgi:hypothetical protein
MSELWVEIEQLVFDGAAFDPAKARRVAALTEMALERLLRECGASAALRRGGGGREMERPGHRAKMKTPPAADEAQWADALASTLLRTIDRSA